MYGVFKGIFISPNLVRMRYKTYVLYYPIKECHIRALLKI